MKRLPSCIQVFSFLFMVLAAILLGKHVAMYGFRQGFIEPSNRGRMYTTLAFITLSALWSEMFPPRN